MKCRTKNHKIHSAPPAGGALSVSPGGGRINGSLVFRSQFSDSDKLEFIEEFEMMS